MTEPDTRPGAYDAALLAIRIHVTILHDALAEWSGRDDTRPQPDVRQAANDAIDAIDAAIRKLHVLRNRLIDEMRAYDDAAIVGADELLRRSREERGEAGQ